VSFLPGRAAVSCRAPHGHDHISRLFFSPKNLSCGSRNEKIVGKKKIDILQFVAKIDDKNGMKKNSKTKPKQRSTGDGRKSKNLNKKHGETGETRTGHEMSENYNMPPLT